MINKISEIKLLSKEIFNEIISIRHHIHKHPELSFKEFKTSAFICSVLDKHKITYTKNIVETGIIAIIEGNNPSTKTILLRADLDALPIEEENNTEYKSIHAGIMHACGHDVHSASVLGTAIILNKLKRTFNGTIKIMFQPGEEVLPGGASLMIEAGVLLNPTVDLAIAQHVFPSMEVGKVGFRSGMYMASTDELHITINGKGGHAAMPAEYINPLNVAATIIQEIEKEFPFYFDEDGVSKNSHNHIPTVVAFGKIEGKGATNVIPASVYMAGTFRTMDEAWRVEVKEKIKSIILSVCEKYKATADINIENGYPFLVNDTELTTRCKALAIDYLGKENVEDLPLRMTAEDFSYITQKVPSCFYRLGTGNKQKGITSGVHTSTFDIDEQALEISTGLMAWMAINEMH
jgi:amidohydrolase